MFFLTLLLEEVLSWTRKQSGTNSLRAIVYFDEVFGYLPPHPANPPTKLPLMTLIKQARAFGVGLLLATQNPVDLDYKALSNAGTWFVGKLQTERDKARLIEGLLGVAAERGTLSDRGYLENVISALGNRVFLMHDVHRGNPILLQSRQALSFLRGPLTREQVSSLMEPFRSQDSVAPQTTLSPEAIPMATLAPKCPKCQADLVPGMKFCPACGEAQPDVPAANPQDRALKAELRSSVNQVPVATVAGPEAPVLPSEISQFYLQVTVARPEAVRALLYQPRLYGAAEVSFVDKKKGKTHQRLYHLLTLPPADGESARWATAERSGDLASSGGAEPGAHWAGVPAALDKARKLRPQEKGFSDHLYNNARLVLLENSKLGLIGEPGEDIVAFRERCRSAARQEAEKALAAERLKYEPRFQALGVPTPEGHVREEESLLDAINPLNWFRAAPRPEEKDRINTLHAEWLSKQADIIATWQKIGEEYTENTLTPRRQDVQVTQFGLAWAPFWEIENAGRLERISAYHLR
jgi:hypothetical protein